MVNNYEEFILEQNLSLLLESRLNLSGDLMKILAKMSHPIADEILDNFYDEKDLDLVANYLDTASDNENITFINDKKAQQIEDQEKGKDLKYCRVVNDDRAFVLVPSHHSTPIFNKLNYEMKHSEEPYYPKLYEVGLILASVQTGYHQYYHIQFGTNSCVMYEDAITKISSAWAKNRQPIKVGRLIRAIMKSSGKTFTDAEIESFVNEYKATYDRYKDIFSGFELVSGADIAFWYNYNNYYSRTGELGNSCMANKYPEYFEIYTKNPEVCSLLILKSTDDEDKIVGRALVWKLTNTDVTFMDRVYCTKQHYVNIFRQYARIQGWWAKADNNSSVYFSIYNPQGKVSSLGTDIEVEIRHLDYNAYPYVDTLKYMRVTKTKMFLSTDETGADHKLEDLGGGRLHPHCDFCLGEGTVECSDCGGDGRVSCEECNGRGKTDCNDCDGDGEVDCNECSGEGCDECKNGKVSCEDCDGSGRIDCGDCDGDGEVDCSECSGRGRVDCGDCR